LAEKKAWDIEGRQSQWDLITINPSLVMGPMLNPTGTTSESFNILKQIGDGTMKMGVPRMGVGLVDVRDVADAHFLAGYTPSAKGRYITSAHNTDFLEMSLALQEKFGASFAIPKSALPKWLLMLIGPLANKLFTRKFIKNNVDIKWNADNSKIKKDLNMSFIPLKKTMENAFQVLVDEKIILPKK
jgi:nucleoside-diphosphate-sugar epimerase